MNCIDDINHILDSLERTKSESLMESADYIQISKHGFIFVRLDNSQVKSGRSIVVEFDNYKKGFEPLQIAPINSSVFKDIERFCFQFQAFFFSFNNVYGYKINSLKLNQKKIIFEFCEFLDKWLVHL